MESGYIMKEKIYTIPVNEAYDTDCECPLCLLEKQLETESVDYALGAAMMEPDHRIESNEKGYCTKHYSMMYQKTNKLSLALVLDTHLEEIRKKTAKFEKAASSMAIAGLFSKNPVNAFLDEVTPTLSRLNSDCMVCEKISHTMDRYADVLLYMWANDSEFRKKFDASKGVCLPHFEMLCRMSVKSLPKKEAAEFVRALCKKQNEELARIQEDIHKFTLKFDYRNADMEWGTAKDAPIRTIEKIAGNIIKVNE